MSNTKPTYEELEKIVNQQKQEIDYYKDKVLFYENILHSSSLYIYVKNKQNKFSFITNNFSSFFNKNISIKTDKYDLNPDLFNNFEIYDINNSIIDNNIYDENVINGKIYNDIFYRIIDYNGNHFFYNVTKFPLKNEQGEIFAAVSIFKDITSNENINNLLKENLERFYTLVETMNEGLGIQNVDGEITYVNQRLCKMLGYSKKEIIGRKVESFLDSKNKKIFQKQMLNSKDFIRTPYEISWSAKDNSSVSTILTPAPIYDKDNKFIGNFAIFTDITKYKNIDQSLRKAEKRLRDQYIGIPIPICTWQWDDDDFVLVDYNESTINYTNGKIVEYLGKTAKDIYQDQPEVINGLFECFYEQRTVKIEIYSYFGDINEKKCFVIRFGYIHPDIVIEQMLDITDRKIAEEMVKKSEQKLMFHIHKTPLAYIELDKNLIIVDWNPAAEEIFGYKKDYSLGKYVNEVIKIKDKKINIKDFFLNCKSNCKGSSVIHEHLSNSGNTIFCEWYITPFINSNSEITGIASLVRNITKRKQVELELQRAKESAENANKSKSEFLANMSHELRTPLNAILGYTQILKKEKNLLPNHKKANDIIHRSGNHLLMLINDILDLSKIEANKMELVKLPFYLPEFLNNIVEPTKIHAQQKNIFFSFELDKELETGVYGDEKRLRQIILNIIGNALKFTQKGSINFSVYKTNKNEDDSYITFSLIDTGIGISEEKIKEIFLPFHQVADNRVQAEGTGLGLAISQRLVNMMGSQLKVKSKINEGSNFWFDVNLPFVAWKHKAKKRKRPNIVGFKGDAKKILIADDNLTNRTFLKDMLEKYDFIVQEAENGLKVIEMINSCTPDLILMDLSMPEMDGFESTMTIRKNNKKIKIIAITANVSLNIKEDVIKHGFDDYIAKPFNIDYLLERLQFHLRINWIYENQSSFQNKIKIQNDDDIKIPEANKVKKIYSYILSGDIDSIRNSLIQLKSEHLQYSSFSNKILNLLELYKLEEIQKYLENILK